MVLSKAPGQNGVVGSGRHLCASFFFNLLYIYIYMRIYDCVHIYNIRSIDFRQNLLST